MAYVSGSYPLDQRKFVRYLAIEREAPTCRDFVRVQDENEDQLVCRRGYEGGEGLTVTQKNKTKNAINKNGISSHPTPLNTAKKPISIGSATRKSVPMTSFKLGFLPPSSRLFVDVEANGRAEDAIEWRDVEIREIRIEPTPPGKPSFHVRNSSDPIKKLGAYLC